MRHWGSETRQYDEGHPDRQAPGVVAGEELPPDGNRLGDCTSVRYCCTPSPGHVSGQMLGRQNIKQAPPLISFPQPRVSSMWTHRHLPRTAAGSWLLLYQVRSCLRTGPSTGFSLEAKRRKRKETHGRAPGLESKTWAPHIQLYSSRLEYSYILPGILTASSKLSWDLSEPKRSG